MLRGEPDYHRVRASAIAAIVPTADSAAIHKQTTAIACAEASGPAPLLAARNAAPSAATPPSCASWTVVVSSPDASAASGPGTRASERVSSGLTDSPRPAPIAVTAAQSPGPWPRAATARAA